MVKTRQGAVYSPHKETGGGHPLRAELKVGNQSKYNSETNALTANSLRNKFNKTSWEISGINAAISCWSQCILIRFPVFQVDKGKHLTFIIVEIKTNQRERHRLFIQGLLGQGSHPPSLVLWPRSRNTIERSTRGTWSGGWKQGQLWAGWLEAASYVTGAYLAVSGSSYFGSRANH